MIGKREKWKEMDTPLHCSNQFQISRRIGLDCQRGKRKVKSRWQVAYHNNINGEKAHKKAQVEHIA